jgi:hypothetical protein
MTSAGKPLVYLILGATGSGRREIVADLIEGGLGEADRPVVLLPAAEGADPVDGRLPAVQRWTWSEGNIVAALPGGANPVFFVTDGARSAVDQIEAFKPWLASQGGELARIMCVVHVRLAARHAALLAWYEACVHFSDVVLLNRREGVENKWLSGFLGHFKKLHWPCLFEQVREGRVRNPALILEPQARRLSQVFDEEAFTEATMAGVGEIDETDDEDAEGAEEEEGEAVPAVDPYFARRSGGRRVKELPDIGKFLPAEAPAEAPAAE